MIGWSLPLSLYPAGYGENPKVPLSFVALGSQKSGMVLHFLCFYGHPTLRDWFISEWSDWEERRRQTVTQAKPRPGFPSREVAVSGVGKGANQYKKSGKKLDMGKGCVRSKSWRTSLSTWSAAPLRASPWMSTWPTTGRRGRS